MDSFWFRHDCNANTDAKMLKIQSKYGWAGYGMFWFLVESLYNNDGRLDADAMRMLCQRNAIADDFPDFCVEIELLKRDNGFYFSERLDEEIDNRVAKSAAARASAEKRWHNKKEDKSNANAMLEEKRREEKNNKQVSSKMKSWISRNGVDSVDGYIDRMINDTCETCVKKAWKKFENGRHGNTPSAIFTLASQYHEKHA